MTKLEMCMAIYKPKTQGQMYFAERMAENNSKEEIKHRYNQMLKREEGKMDSTKTAMMKKDFSKVIGKIRKEKDDAFPKAMMTGQQMTKGTATVNCGGEWRSADYSMGLAMKVNADPRFQEFLTKYGAMAVIESNNFGGVQVRIYYK